MEQYREEKTITTSVSCFNCIKAPQTLTFLPFLSWFPSAFIQSNVIQLEVDILSCSIVEIAFAHYAGTEGQSVFTLKQLHTIKL